MTLPTSTLLNPTTPTSNNTNDNNHNNNTNHCKAPHHRTKLIYLIRHAEALHNVLERKAVESLPPTATTEERERARRAVLKDSSITTDPPLSTEGRRQADGITPRLHHLFTSSSSSSSSYDMNTTTTKQTKTASISNDHVTVCCQAPSLILVSPLRRAIETAVRVFGNQQRQQQDNNPRFVAIESLRERRTGYSCDERSSLSTLERDFPMVDFSQLDDDNVSRLSLTAPPEREDKASVRRRVKKLINEYIPCYTMKECCCAIVTHKGVLREWHHVVAEEEGGGKKSSMGGNGYHHIVNGSDIVPGQRRISSSSSSSLSTSSSLSSSSSVDEIYKNAEVRVAMCQWEEDGSLVKFSWSPLENVLKNRGRLEPLMPVDDDSDDDGGGGGSGEVITVKK